MGRRHAKRFADSSLCSSMQENTFGLLGLQSTTFQLSSREEGKKRMLTFTYAQTAAQKQGRGVVTTLHPGLLLRPRGHRLQSRWIGVAPPSHGFRAFVIAHVSLNPKTTDLPFVPQLEEGRQHEVVMAIAPKIPPDTLLDYGLAGVLNVEGVPGKRQKGNKMSRGARNGRLLDRDTGIASDEFTSGRT